MKLYHFPFYGPIYRALMKLSHKWGWHYAPKRGPISPDNTEMSWCQWCGLRYTWPNMERMVKELGAKKLINDGQQGS